MWLFILGAIIAIIGGILLYFIIIYNKYQFAIIKISEAENNIDFYLQKKLDFLSSSVAILKENVEDEDLGSLEKVLLLKSKNKNNYELNEELEKAMVSFYKEIDLNPKLESIESLSSLQLEMEENEEELEAAKQYYNDNVSVYNRYVRAFPTNIIGLLFHYHHKEFYSNEKEEIFEILKK